MIGRQTDHWKTDDVDVKNEVILTAWENGRDEETERQEKKQEEKQNRMRHVCLIEHKLHHLAHFVHLEPGLQNAAP